MLLFLRQISRRGGTFSSLLNFARIAHCILLGLMKRIEGNNPLVCNYTALTMKNSRFRLDQAALRDMLDKTETERQIL